MKPNQTQEAAAEITHKDLVAFAGVRAIIGDPHGKLMQDEVADRIQKLVSVLRKVVGIVDAFEALDGTSRRIAISPKKARWMIIQALDEAMPEWESVLQQILNANKQTNQ
jgi:hypothetical protein